ncbi:MAG: hypothetical protein J7K77_04495 [Dehalococcoidales bacterium]|nr:hypothetical protein [Dehalococcoidales bacterium]
MSRAREVSKNIWYPIVITTLVILGFSYQWPTLVIFPIIGAVLIIGLVGSVTGARHKELEQSLTRLRQIAGYFNRRFMGDSSLSIFAIIDSLFSIENPRLWEWARACDMSRRVFNTWCNSFINRMESDVRTGRLESCLYTYLNELWLVNNHYYEFIQQFYEIAGKVDLLPEARGQYNRLVMEYNAFAQEFRETIGELKKVARTEIEPPSVRSAKELSPLANLSITTKSPGE